MNEHPPTLRDEVSKLPPSARYHLEWVANWVLAWEYAESRGWADGIGTHEYWLLIDLAWREGLPLSQTSMRIWIRNQVVPYPDPNPDEEESHSENP